MVRTLLVIDVQNEYFPGGLLPLWQAEETEARIVQAIERARHAGDQVVLVQHLSQATQGPFAKESDGAAIRPAIRAAAGNAPVVTKHAADAFQQTELSTHLAKTKQLTICGMMTQNCVVFTALSKSADSLDVSVRADLCSAPSELVHNVAINALASKGLVAADDQPKA